VHTGEGVSVALNCGVFVGCGGRVSVSGSNVTGALVSEGNNEQAVMSAVRMSNVKNKGKYFTIL
jgi:hypothetical protein